MSVEEAVRARLAAEVGRVFVEMVAAQEQANARARTIAEQERTIQDLRRQLAHAQDEIQKGGDS